ncbi:MAG: hypothetical protein LJE65_01150 [Desulfobacteraceae bacterium]|nr:hypothetical protein [Desulfobacteraceae bacterium]
MPEIRFTVERYAVVGENPLSEKATRKVLSDYLGEQKGLGGLEAAAKALEAAIRDNGWAFHRVSLPPQSIEEGTVQLRVSTVPLVGVSVEGAEYFSEDNIRASLPPLVPGGVLNTREVARALRTANEHPAKRVTTSLKPAKGSSALEATIQVDDSRPDRLYASFSNTGDSETGYNRLSVGFQHANLFDRDHIMTLSYTTSPDNVYDVTQLGVFYRAPIYSKALGISAFATYSNVDQGQVADFFNVTGSGRFVGASVDYAFLPIGFYIHKLTAGVQSRRFENDTLFEEEDIGTDVQSVPLSLRYDGRWERAKGNGGFYVEYAHNIEAGSDNDDLAYELTRPGAEASWQALRYGADLELNLPRRWTFRGRLTGQAAGEPLIPGEQYGIGGIRTVRGFDERAVTAESGQHVSVEFWMPPFNPNLRALGFVDLGWTQAQDPVLVGEPNEFISGAGFGFRWHWVTRWKNDLYLQVDAAHVLNDASTLDSGFGKINFNLFFRF